MRRVIILLDLLSCQAEAGFMNPYMHMRIKKSGSLEALEHYSKVFKDYTSILLFLKEALQPRGNVGAGE